VITFALFGLKVRFDK